MKNFFHRYSLPAMRYCVDKGVRVPHLLQYLCDTANEAAMVEAVAVQWEEPPVDWEWSDHEHHHNAAHDRYDHGAAAE